MQVLQIPKLPHPELNPSPPTRNEGQRLALRQLVKKMMNSIVIVVCCRGIKFDVTKHISCVRKNPILKSSVAQIQSWSCSLGLVLAFLQDQDQEQDRVFLARPRPRLTVQDLSKNKT
ncbi:jg4837 [Pararge aegeria aegeria]|uniref:Jg4837 protein n=1 Tax=Pararge aegeria aegeria TaxID=348720 RepID=A0A8S4QGB4_9NEOP|nr:jg4837 [Pararge aegeria aegeria]